VNLLHLKSVARKEFRHVLRDKQTLFVILSLPLIMMFLFGYALKSEIEDARVVVIDPHPSDETRSLCRALDENRQFQLAAVETGGDPAKLLVQHRARALIELPVDYARRRDEAPLPIGFVYDGSDPATATTLRAALPAFFRTHFVGRNKLEATELVTTGTRFLYNPDQKSALFFVPGLMATILAMIGTLLTSVTVTREKELGTMTNLRLSSLSASEVIVGKLAPYFAIASAVGVFILLIGRLAFGVIPQGSVGLLAWTTALYLLVSLGIGLLISTIVQKQQHAMLLGLGITMMPTIMLSGFVFPRMSLPTPLYVLSCVVPATWYLQIVRGIVLKAATLKELWLPALVLGGQALLLLGLASRRFGKEH
jgi:ABC-2 type transport system permease protein